MLYPPACVACGMGGPASESRTWCARCLEKLRFVSQPFCPRCGHPYSPTEGMPDHLCGMCLENRFRFDRARSAAFYEGAVRRGILALKFESKLYWAPALAELLWINDETRTVLQEADLILPVPIHRQRIRIRGFNQAVVLVRCLKKIDRRRVAVDLLVRSRHTRPQTRLSRQERLENVRGAFHVTNPRAVEGRSVVLVDDVFTTGTTLDECARVLKKCSAGRVQAVTVGRALPGPTFFQDTGGEDAVR